MRRRATRSLLESEGCTWGCAWLSLALVTGVKCANSILTTIVSIITIVIITIIVVDSLILIAISFIMRIITVVITPARGWRQ